MASFLSFGWLIGEGSAFHISQLSFIPVINLFETYLIFDNAEIDLLICK